jgi:hypothetical protein
VFRSEVCTSAAVLSVNWNRVVVWYLALSDAIVVGLLGWMTISPATGTAGLAGAVAFDGAVEPGPEGDQSGSEAAEATPGTSVNASKSTATSDKRAA